MKRATVLQEIRNMRFEEVYERHQAGRLTQEDMAEIRNVDARTVRRWMRRYIGGWTRWPDRPKNRSGLDKLVAARLQGRGARN